MIYSRLPRGDETASGGKKVAASAQKDVTMAESPGFTMGGGDVSPWETSRKIRGSSMVETLRNMMYKWWVSTSMLVYQRVISLVTILL